MNSRAVVENADTVSLVCALLVRFPELASIRSGPADGTVRLTFIVRRRLDECARALVCGAQRGRTITAIAFDYGFNSPTHFGRVFRAKFGLTPREYRRDTPPAA